MYSLPIITGMIHSNFAVTEEQANDIFFTYARLKQSVALLMADAMLLQWKHHLLGQSPHEPMETMSLFLLQYGIELQRRDEQERYHLLCDIGQRYKIELVSPHQYH